MLTPVRTLAAVAFFTVASTVVAAPPTDSELTAKIDAIAAKTLAQPRAVGLSIAVARADNLILSKGYGKADLEFGIPMNAETMLRIGSVTKQFSAAAAMKLVEQGKLSLDDTLDKLLPDYPAPAKPITLRHILNHTSGIWSLTSDEKFMARESTLELTPEEVIATFKDKPLEFDPGAEWNYSNSAYYLLGEIIARAAGKPYAQHMQDEFFTPLGLTRTRYESNKEVIPNRAQGYAFAGGKLTNDQSIGADVPGAAGSLISCAADLVRWNLALTSGKVVSPDSYAQMTTPTVLPSGRKVEYGFGLGIDTFEGRKRISHGGGIPGFTSSLVYMPDDRLTVAVISNCENLSPGKVADAIVRAALDIKEFVPKDEPVSPEEFARFVGEYGFDDVPMVIKLFEKDGKMFAQGTGQPAIRLLHQGNGEFRAEFDPTVKFAFPAAAPDAPNAPAPTFVLHQRGLHTATRKQ